MWGSEPEGAPGKRVNFPPVGQPTPRRSGTAGGCAAAGSAAAAGATAVHCRCHRRRLWGVAWAGPWAWLCRLPRCRQLAAGRCDLLRAGGVQSAILYAFTLYLPRGSALACGLSVSRRFCRSGSDLQCTPLFPDIKVFFVFCAQEITRAAAGRVKILICILWLCTRARARTGCSGQEMVRMPPLHDTHARARARHTTHCLLSARACGYPTDRAGAKLT